MMTMDSNMTRSRRTIGNMWEYSDEDHQQLEHASFHHHNTTQTPPQYSDNNGTNSPFDQSPSPYSITTSPFSKSPWSNTQSTDESYYSYNNTGFIGSLIREEGHIYSLAAYGDFLYTGSDSKNIRVWKNQIEFCGFKSSSGLVKAIIVTGDRIFSGHQDGKIRVWKVSGKDPSAHKRIATLPTFKAKIKSSLNPGNYVEVNKNRNAIWIKHTDVISSLSLSQDKSLLYSASWDRMIKVWRVSDFKCLESITAHDDAVNSIVDGFDGLVFTGSADGSVKVWRRETQGKGTKHFFSQTLLQQECAVTALAVDPSSSILYSGSSDGLINFWERYKFLSHGGVLRSHKLAILCLATAGNLVFSGSADKNICVWRRDDGGHICLSVLSGHTGPVKCLTVLLDEDKGDRQYVVYSGSLDKSVKIWKVSGRSGGTQTPPFLPYTSPQSLPSFHNSLKQDSKKYIW